MLETLRLAIALRMARATSQLTQSEMAAELGVTTTVIARNEKPDMAMRADTLVRLVYVMRQREIGVDVFSSLDSVRLSVVGENLGAAAMRAARAAMSLNQQDFADLVGLTKPVVTRGERPGSSMRSDTMTLLVSEMGKIGIRIELTSLLGELTVTVQRQALEAIEAIHQSRTLPGEPEKELKPIDIAEKIREKNWKITHRVE